ncbi:PHP domain-containing protein [Allobaculum sp. Allo2]|uniref:PHP domain-containing protein n=1 Tax=Allobaculum sp. Allo2 TaxID=2853432 RepID=UPI0034621CFB|nr:PHP domain-containing protein [Allobaculum sp. Allo2]
MIHLHTRSRYSLLEAVLDIDDIIRLAKENHQTAVALTDHRSMFATMSLCMPQKKPDSSRSLDWKSRQTGKISRFPFAAGQKRTGSAFALSAFYPTDV